MNGIARGQDSGASKKYGTGKYGGGILVNQSATNWAANSAAKERMSKDKG
jgi:hypothetical protein